MLDPEDTIVAQASARGSGVRGIIRVSGPHVIKLIVECFEPLVPDEIPPLDEVGSSSRPFIRFPEEVTSAIRTGEFHLVMKGKKLLVPCTLYYWSNQHGFTGQPSLELHLPGAQPLLDLVIQSLCSTKLVRLAEPGEFTLRAFLSGRIDLTQAEAVLGVIDATSENELRGALQQLAGNIAHPLAELREQLLQMLCHLEAGFDFSDEDIEFITSEELLLQLTFALKQVQLLLCQLQTRSDSLVKRRLVIRGLPNAGKSSLFNALGEQFGNKETGNALVSPFAGTTRDYLERSIQLGGISFTLVDTAGEEFCLSCEDVIAQKSQQMTNTIAQDAALTILCISAERFLSEGTLSENTLSSWERKLLSESPSIVLLLTQADRGKVSFQSSSTFSPLAISTTTGEGFDQLAENIIQFFQQNKESTDAIFPMGSRCLRSLFDAEAALETALTLAQTEYDSVLTASEIRIALEHIGLITGAVHTDDILDRIFSRFCLGK